MNCAMILVLVSATLLLSFVQANETSTMDVHKMVAFHRQVKQSFHVVSGRNAKSPNNNIPKTSSDHGNLRHLDGMGYEETCIADLVSCQANLDACEEKAAVPSFLFVQMANECKLTKATNEEGDTMYLFSSNNMDDETYTFSDRPFEIADTITTEDFFKNFTEMFSEETGGKPNAVFTFSHADTNEFEGPLIAVQVEAMYEEDGMYSYVLEQSESQA